MKVRKDNTQEFEDVGLLGSNADPFKIKIVTGTPNTYGALALDLTSEYILCVSSSTTSNVVCTPYKSGTSWYVQCKNLDNGNAITSSISVQVIYTTLAATS